MKAKQTLLLLVIFLLPLLLKAGEGMWVPLWLGQLNKRDASNGFKNHSKRYLR